ncbi:uncharacterized protein PHALS_15035 [Plasmopara halstedii]|uniref:Uncharacterized protein n=1 Tax=Plasmopara halstedii TaxID=4781 RepID=A0A0P1A9B5_PLAHL|nr:uncharacterized protein PHALS_15035 [Plasmopara halstedii]CEG37191.1 hypothetical protein PHALS_15035 [Plasmopara halstedii]|eukprot:XP_024573560.1 hypothetical protein PHALS_15035 [Plasmopara halstedii]
MQMFMWMMKGFRIVNGCLVKIGRHGLILMERCARVYMLSVMLEIKNVFGLKMLGQFRFMQTKCFRSACKSASHKRHQSE